LVAFSARIGPYASGLLAVFPVVLTSMILILHNRVGGQATAAVMANAVLGLAGFGFCCLALHLTAEPLGKWAALAIALTVSVGWSFGVLFARKCGLKV
jgi:glucose uptake protein GlcU